MSKSKASNMSRHSSNGARIVIASNALGERLQSLISAYPEIEVLGTVIDGESVVAMCRSFQPDLILLDIRLAKLRMTHIREIKRLDRDIKILIVTDSQSDFEIFSSLGAGADGFLLADNSMDLLHNAIESTLTGAIWLDGMVAPKIKSTLSYLVDLSVSSQQASEALSTRELEVLELVSEGLSNREIAERLALSSDTIKTHIKHILKKMCVSDRTEAAVIAVTRRLIT
jgi:two-component system, NarL family, response regulator LiaR